MIDFRRTGINLARLLDNFVIAVFCLTPVFGKSNVEQEKERDKEA